MFNPPTLPSLLRMIYPYNLGDALATYRTAVAPILQRLGAFGARDHVMAWAEQTVALAVHADGALAIRV